MGVDSMVTIADLIKKDSVSIKGDEKEIFCLQITANWEDIIGESE